MPRRALRTLIIATLACSMPTLTAVAGPATPAAAIKGFALVAGGPSRAVLDAAEAAYQRASELGVVSNPRLLTLIDYSRPSTEPRLWVLDLISRVVVRRELVAHGQGSGDNLATSFSNDDGSHKSSLGLFVTDDAYVGRNGYSLRLHGLDPGLNDHAYARAIVIHGAAYVSDVVARARGRIGRSWGCPAVPPAVARALIDEIKGGTVVFAYGAGVSR